MPVVPASPVIRFLALVAILCCIAVLAHAQSSTSSAKAPAPSDRAVDEWLFTGDAFEGTFLQLNLAHRSWSKEQWLTEFTRLRRLGFNTLVLQWAVYDDVSFLDDGGQGGSTIERILAAAEETGLDCYVGLSVRASWWETDRITLRYLKEELTRNMAAARQLHERLDGSRSFRGWYIPHEMTELLYTDDQREAILDFYAALSGYLKRLDPMKAILASGYTIPRRTHIVRFVLRWMEFLDRSGIDVLIFQDGAGIASSQDWRDVLPFVEAVTILDEEFAGDVWLLAEIFTQIGGKPLDEGPFRAKPADIGRVREQLDALGRFERKLIAFDYFAYMRPGAGAGTSELLEGYQKLVAERVARNMNMEQEP